MREEKSYVSMYAWLSRIFNNFFGGVADEYVILVHPLR